MAMAITQESIIKPAPPVTTVYKNSFRKHQEMQDAAINCDSAEFTTRR